MCQKLEKRRVNANPGKIIHNVTIRVAHKKIVTDQSRLLYVVCKIASAHKLSQFLWKVSRDNLSKIYFLCSCEEFKTSAHEKIFLHFAKSNTFYSYNSQKVCINNKETMLEPEFNIIA